MKRALSILFAMALALSFSLMATPVAAGTITVGPGGPPTFDYSTIQAAINAANPSGGDTIVVAAGTYNEHVTIDKSLTLQGEDRNTTIVDGSGSGNVIYVTANYVTICGLTATNGEYGIYLISNWSIHHITITDVIITLNSQRGFQAPHSGGYHLIEDCIISDNSGGASYAHQFGNSIIRNCEVFGNGGGLGVAWGSGTLITNNKVHDNGSGIWFDSMSYSTMEKNEVYNNLGSGIGVGHVGHHNTIRDNIVHHNDIGIYMNSSNVIGNKVYHNDVIANTLQALEKGNNIWDNGYPSGGNYWSDYAGVDDFSGPGQNVAGSDGIGDTPYTFSGNQDNYPLMEARRIKCVTTATGTGTACFITSHGVIEYLTAVAAPPPAPVLPHGLFSFNVTGLTPGQNVTITVELPDPVPVGTKWWKYEAGSWYWLPIGSDDGDNIITVTLTDGVFPGDEDTVAGQITDDGGPGNPRTVGWETYPINKARVLLPWIALIAALIVAASLLVLRRRRAQS